MMFLNIQKSVGIFYFLFLDIISFPAHQKYLLVKENIFGDSQKNIIEV